MDDAQNQDDTSAAAANNGSASLFNITGQTPAAATGGGGVSPLEQEVLDEYQRLVRNMNQLSSTLSTLASGPMTLEIAEGLRLLERKVASVYTLMKASVYSIVLQQGQIEGDQGGGGEDGEGYDG